MIVAELDDDEQIQRIGVVLGTCRQILGIDELAL